MTLKVLLHAPTPGALARARSNYRNLLKAEPEAVAEIVVNAGGAKAATEQPDETDGALRLCANSLAGQGLAAPEGVAVVDAAVAHLARRQAEGWVYVRA